MKSFLKKLQRFLTHRRRWVLRPILVLLFFAFLAGAPIAFFSFVALYILFWKLLPKAPDMVKLLTQMATFLEMHRGAPETMSLLAASFPRHKKRFRRAAAALENGAGFAEACRNNLVWLPPMIVRVIEEGERAGDLPLYLRSLLEYHQLEWSFRRARKQALLYPILVFAVGAITGFIIFVFSAPVFTAMYADFGKALPYMTRFALYIMERASIIFWLILLLWPAHIIMVRLYGRGLVNRWRNMLDTFLLTVFTRNLSGENKGEGIGPALQSASVITGRKRYINAAKALASSEKNGGPAGEWSGLVKPYPADVVTAISTATDSGDIKGSLSLFLKGFVSQYYILLNPYWRRLAVWAILLNCLIWGGMVIAFYMPIFSMGAIAAGR